MEPKTYDIALHDMALSVHADVRDAGDALLFMVHGLGCSAASFRDIWAMSGLENTSIVAVDLPGYGQTGAPLGFSFSMEDQAQVCADIMSRYSSKQIHFLGHSMGGAIGLLLPHTMLNSLASFINVEGNLNPEDCTFGSRRAATVPFDHFESQILPKFKASSTTWCQNGLDIASPIAFHVSAKSLVTWSDNGELLRAFHNLSCPKVYIYGEQNRDHPTVGSVAGIPQIMIEGAGHFVMNDNPGAFYVAIQDFIHNRT